MPSLRVTLYSEQNSFIVLSTIEYFAALLGVLKYGTHINGVVTTIKSSYTTTKLFFK